MTTRFDEAHALHELKHYLPSQGPLKDFIHHNSLHAFQGSKFYDAIFKASEIFGYQVTLPLSEYRQLYNTGRIRADVLERVIVQRKGHAHLDEWREILLAKPHGEQKNPRVGRLRSYWKTAYRIDLDTAVQPLLFRVLSSYLDQGIALWQFPETQTTFLAAITELELNGLTSFFKTARARNLLLSGKTSLAELLSILVGGETYWEQYLFDQQFSHQGWSGLVAAIEREPNSLLDRRTVSLRDVIAFELLLEIDALDAEFGDRWAPLATAVDEPPTDLFAAAAPSELKEALMMWQDAFEWSYYDEVLAGMALLRTKPKQPPTSKSFQALFCIDERECSLRRHIENRDETCETFGTPGFFSVEFYFLPKGGKFYDKLCPAPVFPKYVVKETDVGTKRRHELLYSKATHGFIRGALATLGLGFASAFRLILDMFWPRMRPAISNAFGHMFEDSTLEIENTDPSNRENGLQIGFTVEEMAARVEALLRSIALTKDFAPLVYAIAHGSSSANNPHHGAHDCGACSGRPGSINSRVFAFMANHKKVRDVLRTRGIDIPDTTQFVGALHDTASDQIAFYDLRVLSGANLSAHEKNRYAFEDALDMNAKERSRRFASISTTMPIKKIRKAIRDRSVSFFEPRPELGHGTNSLCIVGGRHLTKGLFLDRRAFMNSYDHRTDPDGQLLFGVMKPLGLVCGGINLEYYFSRMDNHKLGAGTKLPHHVMGLIGVSNSFDGDLRAGLPLQMIEVHDPVRLMLIVEHKPDVVLKTIQKVPEVYEWYANEWVHLTAVDPETGGYFYFKNGAFHPYQTLAKGVDAVKDVSALFERARKMETNQTVDATRENLPVYLID